MIRIEIPMKLPSYNEYDKANKTNKYIGWKMKREVQDDIAYFINRLPKFEKPIKIHFTWVDINGKRDLDNVCFAKKFILDAMQECGKLENDNKKWVTSFTDDFKYGDEYKVILEIEEV